MRRKRKTKRKKPTDIERMLSELLDEVGAVYVREYKIGTYRVDFYIPDCKLSIQADSGYWHTECNSCTSVGNIIPRQRYQALRDTACIAYHKATKRSIMRFCGCELKDDKEFVKDSILKALEVIKLGNLIYREREFSKKGKENK